MKYRLLIGLFACLMLSNLQGQAFELGFQVGWGTYQMAELSEYFNEVEIPLDTRVVEDYPPYLYYQPELSWGNDTFSIGISYSFQSTGARISVKDYSGEYRMDSRIKSHAPAILYKRRIMLFEGFQQRIYCKAGAGFTRMVLEEYFELENTVEFDDAYEFSSVSGFVEPGISVAYSYRFMTWSMNLGYFLQYYSSPLKEEEYGYTFWASNYNTNARPNWSGVRIGLTMSFRLARD